jgi:hypothetical protein
VTDSDYAVVLFHSTQAAIKAERALLLEGFTVKLIPTPRQFSSSCGTALRCSWADVTGVRAALSKGGVDFVSVYKLNVRR